MPTKISPLIESVNFTEDGADKIITIVLRYEGAAEQDLSEQFVVDEQLDIEIPSHAPPPEE